MLLKLSILNVGKYWLYSPAATESLFTENETNNERIFSSSNGFSYVKDGINNYIVQGKQTAVNPEQIGTKAAIHYILENGICTPMDKYPPMNGPSVPKKLDSCIL
jgi:hypothetical protein